MLSRPERTPCTQATINTINSHSGYTAGQGHDDHHKYFNVNYGISGVLDWLHDTAYKGAKTC